MRKNKNFQSSTKPYDILINNLNLFFNEINDVHLTEDQKSEINSFPKRFCKYGDMLIFNETISKFMNIQLVSSLTEEQKKSLWNLVGETLKVKNISIVYNIENGSQIRSPNVILLSGNSSIVKYTENNIKFTWDLKEVMFSRGNISEKLRLSRLNCRNEIVVDLFAGIGYFVLTYLLHSRAKFLYGCELNSDSVKWLKRNLVSNKIEENRYRILEGDCAVVAPRNVAQRVNLGLIPDCRDYWQTACEVLCKETGGVLHLHENVTSWNESSEEELVDNLEYNCNKRVKVAWNAFAMEARNTIKEMLEKLHPDCDWSVKCSHLEHVKSYAPHIDHLVLDLFCLPL